MDPTAAAAHSAGQHPTSLHASAAETLREWPAPNAGQDSMRHTYLAFLDAAPDACLRRSAPGHLTASTLLVDADLERVLLTLHPRVGRWIQLGGHCEPEDASIQAAALREATEESGMTGVALDPVPLELHTHPITCSLGVPTRHLDVRFLAVAPPGAQPVRSAESDDLRWWRVGELPDAAEHDTIARMIALARRR
ncbi:NUDIX hydrolase [Tomitella fengzijianii]|uniref:NUDIX hydrolase n=2 Tax=Tomitella fengzijianii TaxID=2597660 RepID=A0A516X7J1_9ACTN|nr:NUDIX hydrolase [Tomitella fengzijianii]